MTPKEQAFVAEYLLDLNQTQAAKRAFNMDSDASAQVTGSRYMSRSVVRDAIARAQARIAGKIEVDRERVLRTILAIAEADPRKAYHADGTLMSLNEMPDEIACTIAAIEVDDTNGEIKRIKFWDKPKALHMLGQTIGMFKELHEHTGKNGAPLITAPLIDFSGLDTETLKRLANMPNGAAK